MTTAARWYLKGCPKCNGDQQRNDEGDLECWQCGNVLYNEDPKAYRSPVPDSLIDTPVTQARGPMSFFRIAWHTKGAIFSSNEEQEATSVWQGGEEAPAEEKEKEGEDDGGN